MGNGRLRVGLVPEKEFQKLMSLIPPTNYDELINKLSYNGYNSTNGYPVKVNITDIETNYVSVQVIGILINDLEKVFKKIAGNKFNVSSNNRIETIFFHLKKRI